jgi:hypothetical protein
VGAGGGATVTVVDADRDPPSPTAAIVYCVVLRGHTGQDPLGSTLPTPWSIEALEAFAADHARVAHWPCWIAVGLAERDTVGAGGGRTTFFGGQRAFALFTTSLAIAIASLVRHAQYTSYALFPITSTALNSSGHSLSLPALLAASTALSAAGSSTW